MHTRPTSQGILSSTAIDHSSFNQSLLIPNHVKVPLQSYKQPIINHCYCNKLTLYHKSQWSIQFKENLNCCCEYIKHNTHFEMQFSGTNALVCCLRNTFYSVYLGKNSIITLSMMKKIQHSVSQLTDLNVLTSYCHLKVWFLSLFTADV